MRAFGNILIVSMLVILMTKCSTPEPAKILDDETERAQVIAGLLNDDYHLHELLDSIISNHPKEVIEATSSMMQNDHNIRADMVDRMIELCQTDSATSQIMMEKMMDMCEHNSQSVSMMCNMMTSKKRMMKTIVGTMNERGMLDKSCMEKSLMSISESENEFSSADHLDHH